MFVLEYLNCRNKSLAAERAGWKKSSGQRMYKELEAYIREKEEDGLEDRLIADKTEVAQTLTRILRRKELEYVVAQSRVTRKYKDKDGKTVTEVTDEPKIVKIPATLRDVNRAAELLGKSYAMFSERVSFDDVPVVITGDLQLSD